MPGFGPYVSHDYPTIPRASPHYSSSPQVVHVIHHSKHHSSSKHKHHHHSHSNSHTRPPPSPITPSTSYQSYQTAPPVQRVHFPAPSRPPAVLKSALKPTSYKPFPPPLLPKPTAQHPDPLNPKFQYSECNRRRKALCIGINYRGQANELRGCINDAKHVRDFLLGHRYKSNEVMLLTDETNNPRTLPTRANIIAAMHWLVQGAEKNDSLFFHYSGHGGQTPDKDGDEIDGWDEVIFPLDFKKNGQIIDDVKPLPPGCRLTCCHSGTALDLPYIYSSHGRLKGSHISDRARARKTTPSDVISWSGCMDGQTSADTFSGGVAVGAMSNAFITALDRKPVQTYQELLRSVRLILHPRFSQKPQLGSSHHIVRPVFDTSLEFIF
ncbi:caspase domain-containing protein [Crassisporium funariophilum]|nr:caspase domain-containing protein [Crassisporium funariophilum]